MKKRKARPRARTRPTATAIEAAEKGRSAVANRLSELADDLALWQLDLRHPASRLADGAPVTTLAKTAHDLSLLLAEYAADVAAGRRRVKEDTEKKCEQYPLFPGQPVPHLDGPTTPPEELERIEADVAEAAAATRELSWRAVPVARLDVTHTVKRAAAAARASSAGDLADLIRDREANAAVGFFGVDLGDYAQAKAALVALGADMTPRPMPGGGQKPPLAPEETGRATREEAARRDAEALYEAGIIGDRHSTANPANRTRPRGPDAALKTAAADWKQPGAIEQDIEKVLEEEPDADAEARSLPPEPEEPEPDERATPPGQMIPALAEAFDKLKEATRHTPEAEGPGLPPHIENPEGPALGEEVARVLARCDWRHVPGLTNPMLVPPPDAPGHLMPTVHTAVGRIDGIWDKWRKGWTFTLVDCKRALSKMLHAGRAPLTHFEIHTRNAEGNTPDGTTQDAGGRPRRLSPADSPNEGTVACTKCHLIRTHTAAAQPCPECGCPEYRTATGADAPPPPKKPRKPRAQKAQPGDREAPWTETDRALNDLLRHIVDKADALDAWDEAVRPGETMTKFDKALAVTFGTGQVVSGHMGTTAYSYRGGKTPAVWLGWHRGHDKGPQPAPTLAGAPLWARLSKLARYQELAPPKPQGAGTP